MANKLFKNLIFLTFVTLVLVMLFIDDGSAAEARPQRRRRPSSANVDTEGDSVSPAPVFPPRFMHQRRMNAKHHQASNKQLVAGKTVQSDIAESCKSEPGCEWSCSETDAYDCMCRCKFEPTAFSPKMENSRFISN